MAASAARSVFRPQVPHRPFKGRCRFCMSSTDILGQLVGTLCQLLQDMRLRLVRLLFELTSLLFQGCSQAREVLRQPRYGFSSEVLFLRQPVGQRFHFLLDVELEALKPSFEIIAKIGGFPQQVLFELRKPAFVLPSLCPEENVPYLVEIAAGRWIVRMSEFTF